jgi:polyhydroxyalkanoate synthase
MIDFLFNSTKSISSLYHSLVLSQQRIFMNYLRNASGYHHDTRDISNAYFRFYSKIIINPNLLEKINSEFQNHLVKQQQLWFSIFNNSETEIIEVRKNDKRFLHPDWSKKPFFNYIKQSYLLFEDFANQVFKNMKSEEINKEKICFYTRQYIDAFSPSNFLFTNPEAIQAFIDTNGASIISGMKNLANDLKKGKISQVNENAFSVGENLANTEGAVVFENELIQLIQYKVPNNKKWSIPLLIIPPWINKFYILDLQQKNSFVAFLINQGIPVFMVSWRNPQHDMGYFSFDDYVEKGTISAIEITQSISKSEKLNLLGYCLGGTLIGVTASVLKKREKHEIINSITFIASMLDFSFIGPIGNVIDAALVRKLQRGELVHRGILNGKDMETAFNLIRPNDLIWYYVINNYLKGKEPFAFDVIYWTNDNTNLPEKMFIFYLKNMILENKLSRKNALEIGNVKIDISDIESPVFVIATKEDHISPAKTCYITTDLVSGEVEFILSESGHVMGVINPPAKNKYGFYTSDKLEKSYEEWVNKANYTKGSWWNYWAEKLKSKSGKQTAKEFNYGSEKYPVIEKAPGKYVLEKCG